MHRSLTNRKTSNNFLKMAPVGRIAEFDVENGNWATYMDRLEMYFKVNEVKEEMKVPTLIAVVGDTAYELIVNLVSPMQVAEIDLKTITEVVGDHLHPKPSEMAERYRFRQRRQLPTETIGQYVAALKKMSRYCEFKEAMEENLKDQLVCGLKSDIIRQRLFAEPKLSYQSAISLATSLEAAEKDAAAVEGKGNADTIDFNYSAGAMQQRQQHGGGHPCLVCGHNDHQATSCKFKTYRCGSCNTVGHLRKMCPVRLNNPGAGSSGGGSRGGRARGHAGSARGSRGGRQPGRQHGKRRFEQPTYYLHEGEMSGPDQVNTRETQAESSEDEAIYQMSLRNYPAVSIPINISGIEILMEIDTGSACSCINKQTLEKYFKVFTVKKGSVVFRFYDGSSIKPIGLIEVPVTYGEVTKVLDLYIINNGTTSLIGRQWLSELGIRIPSIKKQEKLINHISESESHNDVSNILGRCSEVFAGGLGRYSGGQARLEVRGDAHPVFCRARPLPYSLRAQVDAELDYMLAQGVIEPVNFSHWASPLVLVTKPNGKIRICADYKVSLNPSLLIDRYPLPRVEDIFANLHSGEQFTRLDLSTAYNQIELDEDSRQYTVINTHRGLFKYNRLVYGLASSSGIFCRIITNIMAGLPGVSTFCDDILLTGKDRQSHIKTLQLVLDRLRANGLKINKEKCIFLADSVSYLGYIIDKQGVHTDPEKIKAIKEMPLPLNITQLRSFLGLVNFYGKFINNLSTHLAPLYELLNKSVTWSWTKRRIEAYKNIKILMTKAPVLAHYNEDSALIVTCDASAVGIGAVLSQPSGHGGGERPIAYGSRTLTLAEKGYSQIQREALAIIYAVKKFHQYIYGRKFILKTDHKPLVAIFGSKSGIPVMAASRLQRWAIILSGYNYDITYVKSKDNGADGLSRLPLSSSQVESQQAVEQTYLHFANEALLLDYSTLRRATLNDRLLGRVLNYVRNGWPSENEIKELQPYFNRRKEIYEELDCVMWGHRVIIPEKCRERVLAELHDTHMGIVKTKSLARSYVWWPGIDEAVTQRCQSCETCAQHAAAPPAHAPQPWTWYERPWRRLHVDFLGPIFGYKYLIVIDSTSKWIEAFNMSHTTAVDVIRRLRGLFAQFGLPHQIVSDNGPPFTGEAFKYFLKNNGIEQILTAPYHPASNGAAENAVKLIKSVIKKAVSQKIDVEAAIDKYLLVYRNTEHTTTGETPAKILQNRKLRTRLDLMKPDLSSRIKQAQNKQILSKGGAERSINIGERVYLQNYERGLPSKWIQGEVVERLGETNYTIQSADDKRVHRHIDQLRRVSARRSISTPLPEMRDALAGSLSPKQHACSLGTLPLTSRSETAAVAPPSPAPTPGPSAGPSPSADAPLCLEPAAKANEVIAKPSLPATAQERCDGRPDRIRKPVKRYGFEID